MRGILTTPHRVISYTYPSTSLRTGDSLYRLTDAEYSTGEFYQYAYDPVGNRLSLTTGGGVVNYAYDDANRLTSVNGQAYTWDDNGNLLSDGVRSYTYDHANRLVQVVSGTLTTGFTYNGAGDRVAKIVDGVTTNYVLDPAAGLTQVLQETTGGQATTYLYGHDLLAQYDSGTWAYHLNDGLGSVRQLADPSGQVVASYSFSPFGVPLGESGGEPYGFTGEQWDAEVELLYLRARYMQPRDGIFLSRDPVRSNHPYQYAGANPVNLTDPTGLYSMKEIKSIFNNASLYDPGVLDYFRPGGSLEGRWGWLEVLRTAENGDRVVVIDRIGGCPPEPDQPWVSGPEIVRQDIGGEFQKTGSELLIGGDPHLQVALEGHRYQIQKNTHCIPNFPYGELCDPIYIQNWVWKADVNATYRYMGLRRDPALTDPTRLAANIIALITPALVEDFGELIGTGIEVVEATSRRDIPGAHQEVTLFLIKETGKRVHPVVVIGAEVVDLGEDAGDILESAGYRWVP